MIDPHHDHRGIRETEYTSLVLAWGSLTMRANRLSSGPVERKAAKRWLDAVVAERNRRIHAPRPMTDYVLSFE